MASKLYPPQVEGILPAFFKEYDDNGDIAGARLDIPFGLNRAVAIKEIYKLQIRIKTVSTNTEIYSGESNTWDKTNLRAIFILNADEAAKFNEGQFYKAQLAFIDQDKVSKITTIGYWSTVGTIKCVAKPTVSIAGFDEKNVNGFLQEFVGVYQQDTTFGDSTEKVEDYEFNIWNIQNELILSSGLCLHNSADDVSASTSQDIFKTNHLIKEGTMYYIQYTVTTLNNLQISSPLYKIMQTESVNIEYPLELHGRNKFEEGYIELYLRGQYAEYTDIETGEKSVKEQMYTGTFLITRGSDKDDYFEWNEIIRFNMDSGYPSQYSFRDFTVEQGITYKYRIQQYNIHKLYSNPIYLTEDQPSVDIDENGNKYSYYKETTIVADFEDMFLYDGKRQLKVRFNPKVTSFKNSIPEQKIETIGSKYPFIFRNGHVNYKEFPISGLISYTMDDAMLFLNSAELEEAKILEPTYIRTGSGHIDFVKKRTNDESLNPHQNLQKIDMDGAQPVIYTITQQWQSGTELVRNDINANGEITGIKDRVVRQNKDLTTENIMGERYFKLKVLDWLTNGEVKLFRSPGEGNYLVRILNVSMSPTDSLGRMLHTFTGTCYEIDDLTYNNLIHYGIVTENVVSLTEIHWGTGNGKNIIEYGAPNNEGFYEFPLNSDTVIGFDCVDFAPGDIIRIVFADVNGYQDIVIGNTGAYDYNYDDRIITSIQIKPDPSYDPYMDFSRTINYNYEGIQNRKFDTINAINTKTQIARQYIGPYENVMEHYYLYDINDNGVKVAVPYSQNVVDEIQRHPNIRLGEETIKFDVLQVEIMHAQARQLIPVFALGVVTNDEEGNIVEPTVTKFSEVVDFEEGQEYYTRSESGVYSLFTGTPEEGGKYYIKEEAHRYALTPFGTGYVNYNSIYPVPKSLNIVENNVLQELIDHWPNIYINSYDIEEINFTLGDSIATPINAYSVLQVFSPVIKNNEFFEWQPTNFYYDTYTNQWNKTYEPYISINDAEGKFDRYDIDENGNPTDILIPDSTNKIYLDDVEELTFTNLGQINQLKIGNGAMVELTFQLQVVDYSIEEENVTVKEIKDQYLEAKENYFNKTIDYYTKRQSEDYQNLEGDDGKIQQVEQEIMELAEHVAINLVNTDESKTISERIKDISNEDGTPILSPTIYDSSNNIVAQSEYAKIVSDLQKVLQDAADAVPLKQQLIMIQTQIFNELLNGWTDGEESHPGLLNLPPIQFGSTELLDISSEAERYYNYPVSNFDEYTIGYLTTTNDWPARWWPRNYMIKTKDNEQAYYCYNWAPKIGVNTTGVENDTSFNVIQSDFGYNNTITAILWRINNSGNFNYLTLNQLVGPEGLTADFTEEDLETKSYIWSWSSDSGIFVNTKDTSIGRISDIPWYWYGPNDATEGDLQQVPKGVVPSEEALVFYSWKDFIEYKRKNNNYINLIKYINNSKYNINIIEGIDSTNLKDSLQVLQNNDIMALYTLAHTPNYEQEEKVGLIKNNAGIYQYLIENDYLEPNTENPRIYMQDLLKNKLVSVASEDIIDAINNLFQIVYTPVIDSIDVKKVYWANIGTNDNPSLKQIYQYRVENTINDYEFKIEENDDETVSIKSYKINFDNEGYAYYIKEKEQEDGSILQNELKLYEMALAFIDPDLKDNYTELMNTYIINDKNLLIPIVEDNTTKTIQLILKDDFKSRANEILLELINDFSSHSFWEEKTGRFVEAKDDVVLAYYDLLKIIVNKWAYQKYKDLLDNNKTQLWQEVNTPIDSYVIDLEEKITNAENMQSYWQTVYDQTGIELAKNTITKEDSDKLIEVQNTAKYKIRLYQFQASEFQQILDEFKVSDAYNNYSQVLNDFDKISQETARFQSDYTELMNTYIDKLSIYELLKSFIYDLTLRSSEDKIENISFNKITLSTYLDEYIVNSPIKDVITGTDIINYFITDQDTIDVKLGYFTILELLNELDENSNEEMVNENWEAYKEKIKEYEKEYEALNEHYELLTQEIADLESIYKNRQNFVSNLQEIIDNYNDLIEGERAELLGKINLLTSYLEKVEELNSQLPGQEDINTIKELLTKYLITLQQYYIENVERRYNV